MSAKTASGTVIEGKYRLERELGAGGMGAVWLATQLMVDRHVAVKLLHPAFIDQEDLQARFEVEAKAIGRLNHPNCITLYDFGYSEDLGAFYTVIEYIEGVSLDHKLGTSMPIPEIVSILRQIAMALGHAHHHGILHRDLKPENVMIAEMTDGSEMAKVLDFGIARIMRGDQSSAENHRITKAGEVFGTPAYMSPEQARSIRELTAATDLYAVGVMFYELVTGRLPFFAESAFDILMMQVTKPVPVITKAGVPDDVKKLIYRLLEKEPEKRHQSCKEFIAALDALDLSAADPRSGFEGIDEFAGVPTLLGQDRDAMGSAPTLLGNDPQRAMAPIGQTTESERPFETINPQKPWGILAALVALVVFLSLGLFVAFGTGDDDLAVEADPDPVEDVLEKDPPEVALPENAVSTADPLEDPPEPAFEFDVVEADPPEDPVVEKVPTKVKPSKKSSKKTKRTKKTHKSTKKQKPPPKETGLVEVKPKHKPFGLTLDSGAKPKEIGLDE